MLYSFSLVILVLFLIGMFRKHEEKIDWIFQGFTVVPIFWIFCCIYYMFNREKKLKQIEFVNYTEKFTKLRKVVFFVSSLMSLASSVLLLIQYFQTSGKTWTKDDITRLICFISLGVFVAILYVCLLVQNEKVSPFLQILNMRLMRLQMRDASVLTSRFWIKSYITMQDTRENRSVRSAFDLA